MLCLLRCCVRASIRLIDLGCVWTCTDVHTRGMRSEVCKHCELQSSVCLLGSRLENRPYCKQAQ